MVERQYFHFTLGPVQGFVAQARRTRDFWAGSFLLSWLSGVAMADVRQQKGEIQFPIPPGDYLDWIQGQGPGHAAAPRQGGIPNRFKSMRAAVPIQFDAQLVVTAVREAWQALAEHVWQCDLLGALAPEDSYSRAIWNRQHAQFWDMSWVLTDDDRDTSWLDQRKNWRSHGFTQAEEGVKCMVMDGWQELSGMDRPGKEGKTFWSILRNSGAPGIKTDLSENEQLCALSYVKRRFARHFASFETTLPCNGLRLQGWQLSPSVPSVAYMAAVHWLERLVQAGQPDEVQQLLQAAMDVCPERNEWDTQIACLRQAVPEWSGSHVGRQLLALDGNLFFEHVQQQPVAYGYDPQKMQDWRSALHRFQRQHPECENYPSPFYAILLMDGDSLGSHMSDPQKQTQISSALLNFTNGPESSQSGTNDSVPDIVARNNGFLIYAGGDDVLAILPLEDALTCAAQVRAHYLNCFAASNHEIPTTISAAIEFAHVKTPLGKVLGDAHKLLDDVAKDGAGRDALAVRVWKTSGQVLQWAQPWKIALQAASATGELVVQQLARHFRQDTVQQASGGGSSYSSKFFYKIEERFTVLNPTHNQQKAVLNEDEALDLLAVDFWASGNNRSNSLDHARELIKPLIQQCRAFTRVINDGKEAPMTQWRKSPELRADGALLVRFLATKGLDQGDQL